MLGGLEANGDADIAVTGNTLNLWADPGRFRQIIRNLITNARRYGGEQTRIELCRRSDGASVAALDNGAGIPDALHEQVFQPYARAHQANTQPASVGLGLSVARELARLMGGDVLHSRDNGWTRFELVLPTIDKAHGPPTSHAAAS